MMNDKIKAVEESAAFLFSFLERHRAPGYDGKYCLHGGHTPNHRVYFQPQWLIQWFGPDQDQLWRKKRSQKTDQKPGQTFFLVQQSPVSRTFSRAGLFCATNPNAPFTNPNRPFTK